MRRKYSLKCKEFWLEIISLNDLIYGPIYSELITATKLKNIIVYNDNVKKILITSTSPNVYVQINEKIYHLNMRLFVAFIGQLILVEEEVEFDWAVEGF